ncbi:MAG TPA: Wzz/FepE/Etk N-terminal domain-containing protein, partial [Gemmatimonadota bacterium]|nr:Wzz/FepE/Etk N-terminal domain-containing protein [Gemmatimonadota bacterium]
MLWRRKWTIGVCAVLALAVAAVLTARMPELFESNATVLIQERPRSNASALEVLEGVGTTDNPVETEIRLITSGRVIEPVVRELALHVSVDAKGEILRPEDAFTAFSIDSAAPAGTYRVLRDEQGGYAIEDAASGGTIARTTGSGEAGPAELEFNGVKLRVAPGDPGIGGILRVGSVVSMAAGVRGSIRAAPVIQDA